MDNLTDYYAVLGVATDASPSAIKSAFKKLALQYHPDVYKGADAHERMRIILLAYQTLNNPEERRHYDSQRSGHRYTSSQTQHTDRAATPSRPFTGRGAGQEVSPHARRDRQRYYDFPAFPDRLPVRVDLIDMLYTLSPMEARTLAQEGMLRGVAPEAEDHAYYCHRCHHRWSPSTIRTRDETRELPRFCPKCQATDWDEYLLLRCIHCKAVFESEQIRYAVGSYAYGKGSPVGLAGLCPPYELFPLCPYCGRAHWSPVEDARVNELRLRAQRAATVRLVVISVAMIAVMLVGALAFGVLR